MNKIEKREPILISDEASKFESYVRKIKALEKETAKFKIVFDEILGENLSIPFTKVWLKHVQDGMFEDMVNKERVKFLATQPKLIHPSINQEFTRISAPLYQSIYYLKNILDDLPYESKISGNMFPDDLVEFENLPINDDCTFNLTDEWQSAAKKQFEIWLTTDQQFEKYDLMQELLSLKARFITVHKNNAPYLWQDLTQNFNEISTSLIIKSTT